MIDGYGPSTYGDRFADVYDAWFGDVSDTRATVERLAALAAAVAERRPVLELGGGSGRLALPLAERGLATWTVDASLAMVRRLRAKPSGHRVHAVVADMAALPLARGPRFSVAVCAFNTLFNLTTTEDQRRCLRDVAARLVPEAGRLVVEAAVIAEDERHDTAGAVEPRHIGLDEVVLTVSRFDPATGVICGQHVQLTEGGIRLRPWVLRYLAPRELDALAAQAGLRLTERHAGWRGEPFTADSPRHVSTYAPVH